MKFLKFLLLFGSCMSTSSGADQLLQYSSDHSSDNGSDDSGVTKKIDQLIKQNQRQQKSLMYAIKALKGATYLNEKSNRDSYRIQEALEEGYPVSFSSIWDGFHINPRMNDTSNSAKAWCAKVCDQKQWIQVNLIEPKAIQAIEMADRADYKIQYVKTYKVSYTENGIDWKYYNNGQILQGYNKKTKLTPFMAKIVRVHPWTWNDHVSLRLEVYFSDKMKPPTYSRKKGICSGKKGTKLRQWRSVSASYCVAKCDADSRCKLMIVGEGHTHRYTGTCALYTGPGASPFSADGKRGWQCYKKN